MEAKQVATACDCQKQPHAIFRNLEAAGIEPASRRSVTGSWRTRLPIAAGSPAAQMTATRCSRAGTVLLAALVAASIAASWGVWPWGTP